MCKTGISSYSDYSGRMAIVSYRVLLVEVAPSVVDHYIDDLILSITPYLISRSDPWQLQETRLATFYFYPHLTPSPWHSSTSIYSSVLQHWSQTERLQLAGHQPCRPVQTASDHAPAPYQRSHAWYPPPVARDAKHFQTSNYQVAVCV